MVDDASTQEGVTEDEDEGEGEGEDEDGGKRREDISDKTPLVKECRRW